MTEAMAKATAAILIVEDDPAQLRIYARALRGHRLICVATGTAALTALAESTPDLIILDHVLADGERGAEFLPRLKAVAAHVPVIVISGSLDIRSQLKVLQGPRAAHYMLEKPVDLDELEATIQTALNECGLAETVRELESLERSEKIDENDPERRFVERLSRHAELLRRLRGADQKPNISTLARDFNVSRRTIHRDLQDLVQRGQLDPAVYPEWNRDAE